MPLSVAPSSTRRRSPVRRSQSFTSCTSKALYCPMLHRKLQVLRPHLQQPLAHPGPQLVVQSSSPSAVQKTIPCELPSSSPSGKPSTKTTGGPTSSPSSSPSAYPSAAKPSTAPSKEPSLPSGSPSSGRSSQPSGTPTAVSVIPTTGKALRR